MNKFATLITIFLLCSISILQAQSKKDLESKRKSLIKDINVTNALIDETKKNESAALDRYIALQNQIEKRGELIKTLKLELELSVESMIRTDEVITALDHDIQQLNEEYAIILKRAYYNKLNNTDFLFILSAEDFNQGYRRWRYLSQYEAYRKKQSELISSTKTMLNRKKTKLEEIKIEKENLLVSEKRQKDILDYELKDKDQLLKDLRKDEKRLKQALKSHKKAHDRLNNAIEDVIKTDVAMEKTKTTSGTKEVKLTTNFSSNRGKLPWPVEKGIITKRFGKQAHPTLHKIEITNNGIDIRTEKNAEVKAVFDGKVTIRQFIPGYDNMIIIQHGEYYTVYSNLEEVFVKKGEKVSTKQSIGVASINEQSNISEVHFEVWRDKTRLNPQDWVLPQ